MRIAPLVFVCLLGGAHLLPARPVNSTGAERAFEAVCVASTDAAGRKSVAMQKSTGSKALDGVVEQKVGRIYGGFSGVNIPFFVACKVVAVQTPHGKSEVTVAMLRPPYPARARLRGEQGRGVIKVSFGKDGQVTGAEMVQSTGSGILDSHTVNFARANWRSTGNAAVSVAFPVDYQLVR